MTLKRKFVNLKPSPFFRTWLSPVLTISNLISNKSAGLEN